MKDKIIAKCIAGEEARQREGLELIPSENYVSRDVLTALGSVFTNKYSEDTQAGAIMVAKNSPIRLNSWQLIVLNNYLVPIMQTFSRILVRQQTKLYIVHG